MVREKKSHLQISVLDLPLLKMAHKNQIFEGGKTIIEANTWNGAEGEKTKASGNKL